MYANINEIVLKIIEQCVHNRLVGYLYKYLISHNLIYLIFNIEMSKFTPNVTTYNLIKTF